MFRRKHSTNERLKKETRTNRAAGNSGGIAVRETRSAVESLDWDKGPALSGKKKRVLVQIQVS